MRIDECEVYKARFFSGDDDFCEMRCENSFGSYSCTCPPGFELNDDKKTCREVDLCNGQCEDECIARRGLFSCTKRLTFVEKTVFLFLKMFILSLLCARLVKVWRRICG